MEKLPRAPGYMTAVLMSVSAATSAETPIDEIIVTAAGFEQKITDAPASVSVISKDDLLSRPHVNLLDMLKYQEGIDVGTTRDKTGQGSVSMRGLTGEYTLYLIDGKRQNNHGDIYPNNFGGNAFGHMPPAEAIERIEVIRGPASTLHGADAMGGVINIITKKVTDTWYGSVNVSGTVQQDDDFGDDRKVDFSVAGPLIPDTLSLGLRASRYTTDPSSPELDPVVDPAGEVHVRTVGFGGGGRTVESKTESYGMTLTYMPNENHTIRLDYDTSRQTYDNTPVEDPETGELSYPLGTKDNIDSIWAARGGRVNPRVGYKEDQEFVRDWWSLSHEGEWSFGNSFVSLAYVDTSNEGRTLPLTVSERLLLQEMYDGSGDYAGMSEDERRALAARTFLPRPDRPLISRQYTLDARLNIPFEVAGSHVFVVGGQMIDGELEDGVFGMESERPRRVQDQEMYSVFVEDSWTPIAPLTITAGVRYDDHQVFGSQVSPRLYGVYNLSETWTLKGGVSTGYKTPQTTDLYDGITGFGGQGTSPMVGNPELKPETSVNSEIALYWDSLGGHNFNITYFNTRFEDKIERSDTIHSCELTGGARPCANVGPYTDLGYITYTQKDNIDKVDIQGVELAGRYVISPRWTLSANYTWTDSEKKSGEQEGQPLTNTAEHMANLTLHWQMRDNLSLSLQSEVRSDRYRGWDTVRDKPEYYKSYDLWNLGLRYQYSDNIIFTGRINNLLDEDFTTYSTTFVHSVVNGNDVYDAEYRDHYNIMAARRNFWLSMQVSF